MGLLKRHVSVAAILVAVLAMSTVNITPAAAKAAGVVMTAPTGSRTRSMQARVVINAPVHTVWKLVTQYQLLPQLVEDYKKSTILASNGSRKQVALTLSPGHFLPSYSYQVQAIENPGQHTVLLRRVAGDFDDLKGRYQLTSIGNGSQTLLRYNIAITPSSGMITVGFNNILKSNTEKTLDGIRTASEKRHRQSLTASR